MRAKTRHILIILLLIGIAGALIYRHVMLQRPSIDDITADIIVDSDGHVVIAKNDLTDHTNDLYLVDRKGNVLNTLHIFTPYYEPFMRIIKVDKDSDYNIWVLREGLRMDGSRVNDIYKVSPELVSCNLIRSIETDPHFDVQSLQVLDGMIYITGCNFDRLGSDGRPVMELVAYPAEAKEEPGRVLMERGEMVDEEWQETFVDSCYDGKRFIMLTNQGRVFSMEDPEQEIFLENNDAVQSAAWIKAGTDCFFYRGLNDLRVHTVFHDGREHTFEVLRGFVDTDQHDGRFFGIVRMSEDQDRHFQIILREYDDEGHYKGGSVINELKIEPVQLLKTSRIGIVLILWLTAAVAIVLMISSFFIRKSRSLTVKMSVVIFLLNVPFAVLVSGSLYFVIRNAVQWGRLTSVQVYSEDQFSWLNEYEGEIPPLEDLAEPSDFLGSDLLIYMRSILDNLEIRSDEDKTEAFSTEVIFDNGKSSFVVFSTANNFGETVASSSGGGMQCFLDRYISDGAVASRGDVIYCFGEPYAVTLKRLEFKAFPGLDKLYLLSYSSLKDQEITIINMLEYCVCLGSVFILLSSLVLLTFIFFAIKPVKRLSRVMASVSNGMYTLPDYLFPDNELGDMWIYLHKLCRALKIRNSARSHVLNFFARFVPEGFERLFSVSEMQSIKAGDVRNVYAAMAVVQSDPGEGVLRGDGSRKYTDYLSGIFERVRRESENRRGILLANDGVPASERVIFSSIENLSIEAYSFAVDVLHSLYADYRDKRHIALLHEGAFVCGMVGDEVQAYTFVASDEVNFLKGYLEAFRRAGVRLVLTEDMVRKLEESGYKSSMYRSLGYVQSADLRLTYKVYEDTSVEERQIREKKLWSDSDMQQGLSSFYKGSLEAARDAFSSVVKAVPEDGIAVWYLFRCEELLHSEKADWRMDLFYEYSRTFI